jgi:hypothetical protein
VPPRFLFQRSALSRFSVAHLLPLLARTGVLPLLFGAGARRILHGVTDVRLRASG